jgi:hypothetical protein
MTLDDGEDHDDPDVDDLDESDDTPGDDETAVDEGAAVLDPSYPDDADDLDGELKAGDVMPIQINVCVRLPLLEIQRLAGPQRQTILTGVAKVLAALRRLPSEPASADALDPVEGRVDG